MFKAVVLLTNKFVLVKYTAKSVCVVDFLFLRAVDYAWVTKLSSANNELASIGPLWLE